MNLLKDQNIKTTYITKPILKIKPVNSHQVIHSCGFVVTYFYSQHNSNSIVFISVTKHFPYPHMEGLSSEAWSSETEMTDDDFELP